MIINKMKKVMTIIGMICDQIGVSQNIKNNLKQTEIEIEQEKIFKKSDSLKEKQIRQNTKVSRKINLINNLFKNKWKKIGVSLLCLIVLLIFIYYYNFLKNKEEFDYSSLGERLPTYKKQEPQQLFLKYEKDKNFFIYYREVGHFKSYVLLEEKNNNGQKTYEENQENNICYYILPHVFFKELLFNNFFKNNRKTINIQGKVLLPIDYKKILDIFKQYYCFFSSSVIFFTDSGFEKISSDNFYEKKNKYQEIKNLTRSKDEFADIEIIFWKEFKKKLKQTDEIDDFSKMIEEIVSVFPKKKELKLVKIKYFFFYNKDQSPCVSHVISYKKIQNIETIKKNSYIGNFINYFYKVLKKLDIKMEITTQSKKKIQFNQENFFEIPLATILFLQKELKDLFLLYEDICYSVFDMKHITYLITLTELEKKKKLIEKQDKKIREYFNKKPIIGPIKIKQLKKIMCGSLLNLDEIKSYCF